MPEPDPPPAGGPRTGPWSSAWWTPRRVESLRLAGVALGGLLVGWFLFGWRLFPPPASPAQLADAWRPLYLQTAADAYVRENNVAA